MQSPSEVREQAEENGNETRIGSHKMKQKDSWDMVFGLQEKKTLLAGHVPKAPPEAPKKKYN
jgi:hypothetical protein